MDPRELMSRIEHLVQDAKTAVLTTVDAEGRPRTRWMTPAILRSRPGVIFAVTSPSFAKVAHLAANPQVEWMFQTRLLDVVVNLRGKINCVDNPSLKSEVMEAVGRRLAVFWRSAERETDFIVLETIPEEAEYFEPMTGHREVVEFG